eukprot:2716310-Amphidinium_carterae.1
MSSFQVAHWLVEFELQASLWVWFRHVIGCELAVGHWVGSQLSTKEAAALCRDLLRLEIKLSRVVHVLGVGTRTKSQSPHRLAHDQYKPAPGHWGGWHDWQRLSFKPQHAFK